MSRKGHLLVCRQLLVELQPGSLTGNLPDTVEAAGIDSRGGNNYDNSDEH